MERAQNIYPEVIEHLGTGKSVALVTIVEARGSTPQIAGASALFSRRGLLLGTLGGGVVEAEVQKTALACLRKGFSLLHEFRLRGNGTSEEALCGGSLRVLIDAMPSWSLKTFRLLQKSLRLRHPGVLVTRLVVESTGRAAIRRKWRDVREGREGFSRCAGAPTGEELEKALRQGKPMLSGLSRNSGTARRRTVYFLEPLFPLPQLVIVGAGHVGRALAHLGKRLDFEVTVIDDRPEFANPSRFPEADVLVVDEISRAVRNFPVSSDTSMVIVTRGHRHDAEALRACIRSPAAYIGMIGSLRKVALMREEFLKEGWATGAEFDRVHAPIGLRIGSTTVEEIAVSIAAELVLVRSRARQGEPG